MPLDTQKEPVVRGFDRFDDSVRSDRARDQRGRDGLDRLVVRAVDLHRRFRDDLPEEAAWCDLHRMGRMDGFGGLSMGKRQGKLRG